MKVYIQSRKVQTKRLLDTLYATKRYSYASKTFRTRAERELAKIKEEVKVGMYNYLLFASSPFIFFVLLLTCCTIPAEMIAREAESKARDFELRHANSKDPEHIVSLLFSVFILYYRFLCLLTL